MNTKITQNIYLIREFYPFGYCPTYKNLDTGEITYHYSIYNHSLDKIITHTVNQEGLRFLLLKFWQPVAFDHVNWYERFVTNTPIDPNLRYCSSHGVFEADAENGNCPSCLAVGSDYCAGAYN
jgi:hypothetical protein